MFTPFALSVGVNLNLSIWSFWLQILLTSGTKAGSDKLKKYFVKTHPILCIPVLLDPR